MAQAIGLFRDHRLRGIGIVYVASFQPIYCGFSMFPMKGKNSTPAETAGNSTASSIITSDVVMIGTLITKSAVQVEGRIDGDVRCLSAVIGDAGQVNGTILAEDVTIRGRVKGSIRARRVFLCSSSHVEGDILIENFAVEVGAIFEGNCRHGNNPVAVTPNRVGECHRQAMTRVPSPFGKSAFPIAIGLPK